MLRYLIVLVVAAVVASSTIPAGAALAKAATGATAHPYVASSNPILRQQQVICDPAAGDLSVQAARVDVRITFSNLPAGFDAAALVDGATITTIAPFGFVGGNPTATFAGNVMTVDDLSVIASTLPPPGPVDFATITLDYDKTITDAQYHLISVSAAFVLDADPAHPSFIQADDGEVFGPGHEGGIDESEVDVEMIDAPEPSATALWAGAAALGLARRKRRSV